MLDAKIEKPATPVVRRLLAHGESSDRLVVTANECADLARWLLKVGLLSAHPNAEHDHPGLQRDPDLPKLSHVPAEWLDWMRTGSTPPAGFSVFITRRNLRGEDEEPAMKQHIVLPRLVVDGEDQNFLSRSFGFAGVNVTIVWHPGWPIVHAQVDAGRAARLWPEPDGVDFGALPVVHPQELAFWDGSIGVIAVAAENLADLVQDPLSVDSDPFAMFFGSSETTRE